MSAKVIDFFHKTNNIPIINYIIAHTDNQDMDKLNTADIYALMGYVGYMDSRILQEEKPMTFHEWQLADPELLMAGKI